MRTLSRCLSFFGAWAVSVAIAGSASGQGATDSGDPGDLIAELTSGGPVVSVQTVVEESLRAAPELRGATAAYRRAAAQADAAAVDVVPRLDLSGGYSRLSDVESTLPIVPQEVADAVARRAAGIDDPVDARARWATTFPQAPEKISARAELSYALSDLFLTVLPTLSSARQLATVERWNLRAQRQAIALQARQVYYEYARARASWVVAQATLKAAREHEQDVRLQVETGVLDRVQELVANERAGTAEIELVRAGSAREQALATLSGLVHRSLPDETAVSADTVRLPPTIAAALPALTELALRQRPELAMLRATSAARRSERRASDGKHWPRLELIAGLDLQNPKPRAFPQQAAFGTAWDVGAVLSWSPNDAVSASANGRAAAAAVAHAGAELEATEQAVRVEVRRAYARYHTLMRVAEQCRLNLAPAQASYAAHRALFRAGAVASRDVVDAEADLREARLVFVNAFIDARLAYDYLRFVVGDDVGLLPPGR